MTRPRQLYLVEDDAELRAMLATYFAQYGMALATMGSAEEMFARMERETPDLILMDVTLPGLSGLEACQRLRQRGDPVAIILLTGRTDEVDHIIGLEMGADDYVDKPFSVRELLARTRAVLRRGRFAATAPVDAGEAGVRIGEWNFVAASRSLHRGQSVRMLNTVEFALLSELTASPGRPVARERLLAVSHAGREAALLRTVDASILRLRRLVETDPSNPRYIQTVRFHGYMFVPDAVEAMV